MYLTEDSTQLHTIHEDHSLSLVSTSENVPQKPGNMMNSSNAFATSLSFMVPVSTKGSLVWLEQRPAWQVFFDPLYAGVLAAVCAIYFVVTGVQSWTTLYMQQVLHAPMPFIVTSFATVAATSPLMGVIVGGIVTDKVGGYQTMKALKRTVGTISLTSFCAAAVAAGAAFNHEKISFIVMIWIALFLGAMCMPALIGIMFSCVPPDHRTTSSSVILVTTNCLGFALGAWLPGFVMSFTSIATGYSVVLLWASLGCLATTIAGIRVFCSTSGCKGTDSLSVPSIDDSDLGIVPQPDDSEAQWCSSESISNETLSVTST
ncbi:MAG: uncharacterized protein KVP18_001248 [Porospora cf. gigantea A]|nr:MAG: hypothetical protein KVP18_001248 [Porospora cf. gigantea A]